MDDTNNNIINIIEEVSKEFIKSHDKYEGEIIEIVSCLKKIFENLKNLPEQVRLELGGKILMALGVIGTFNNF